MKHQISFILFVSLLAMISFVINASDRKSYVHLALILFLSLPMIESPEVLRNIDASVLNKSRGGSTLTQCLSEVDVLSLLQKLSYQSQSEFDQARDRLLEDSRRSPRCKKELTTHIIRAMNNAAVSFDNDPKSLSLWREGARLLGELPSSEVIDFLVSNLDTTTGIHSRSMRHQPATNALIKIGAAAVPQLAAAISHDSNREIRMLAIYCLTSIGLETRGRAELNALRQAVKSQSDQCINHFIHLSIDLLEAKSGSRGQTHKSLTIQTDALNNWNRVFASGC